MTESIVPWEVDSPIQLTSATPADQLLLVATRGQLAEREARQIQTAYNSESYDLLCSFLWQKTATAIKKELAALGAGFIGEILRRPDIGEESSIDAKVTDLEALRAAQDLGMIGAADAMRLRHLAELIKHAQASSTEGLSRQDAELALYHSVRAVLGRKSTEVAYQFKAFRDRLFSTTFQEDSAEILQLTSSPSIFRQTTFGVLLSGIKAKEGAELEHLLANLQVVVERCWADMRAPEKWHVGTAYAEAHAAGKSSAVQGLKAALLRVKGFDFVPENLRSNTFLAAAAQLISAHESYDNFSGEVSPAKYLASLGSTIPPPAISACVTAALCCYLGNSFGHSWAAQSSATEVLQGLSRDRWSYYLADCLPGERRILEKMSESKPRTRFFNLVAELKLFELELTGKYAESVKMLSAIKDQDERKTEQLAKTWLARIERT